MPRIMIAPRRRPRHRWSNADLISSISIYKLEKETGIIVDKEMVSRELGMSCNSFKCALRNCLYLDTQGRQGLSGAGNKMKELWNNWEIRNDLHDPWGDDPAKI